MGGDILKWNYDNNGQNYAKPDMKVFLPFPIFVLFFLSGQNILSSKGNIAKGFRLKNRKKYIVNPY